MVELKLLRKKYLTESDSSNPINSEGNTDNMNIEHNNENNPDNLVKIYAKDGSLLASVKPDELDTKIDELNDKIGKIELPKSSQINMNADLSETQEDLRDVYEITFMCGNPELDDNIENPGFDFLNSSALYNFYQIKVLAKSYSDAEKYAAKYIKKQIKKDTAESNYWRDAKVSDIQKICR